MQWTIGNISFGIIDIVVVAFILIGAVSCCINGFSRSVTKTVGFLVSMPIAMLFTAKVAEFASSRFEANLLVTTLLSFVTLSLPVYTVISILGSTLYTIASSNTFMKVIDSLVGFGWGFFCSGLILFLILSILSNQPFFDFSSVADKSYIIREFINPVFSFVYEKGVGMLNEL